MIDKQIILKNLKADLAAADTLRLENIAKVEDWRNQYNGELYGNEEKGKSKLVSRDIKRQDEWQHASVKDPFVANTDIIKCEPITFEDVQAAKQNQLVLNYQFTRKFPRYRFMTDVIKLYYSEGTVVVKTSWDYEDVVEEVEMPIYDVDPITKEPIIIGTKLVKKLKILKNQPDAEICRLEDIYLDPTAKGNIDKAQFIAHRFESDLSTLRKAKKYKNLNKLSTRPRSDGDSESAISHVTENTEDHITGTVVSTQGTDDFLPVDDTNFQFQDEPRKKLTVYEYWGNFDINNTGIAEPIVCTWVNDVIIRLESNPYPDKKLPFLIVANNSIPFQLYGEAAAELIGDHQKISTAIKRGIIDNMAQSNNAQKGIRTGALDRLNKQRFLNGRNFEFNGSREDFYEGSFNSIPASVFSVLEMTNSETESMVGVKGFSGGINGSALGTTARAAGGVLDAVSVRRSDIIRNLADNLLKPLMRKWMSYNSEFLQEEEVVRVTNEEFVPVKRDDLQGAVDIEITVSTPEDDAAKASELAFMLQTIGPNADPGEVRLIRAEIARLRKMPHLAKKIENYQPQPDPFAEKMKELELRLKEVEIRERESRAQENLVDMRAKTAQAILNEQKAHLTASEKDIKDLEFTRKADGTEFGEKMAEKQHDRITQAGLQHMNSTLTKQ